MAHIKLLQLPAVLPVFFFFFNLHSNLITNLYFSRQLPLLPADARFKSVSEAQCSKGSIPSLLEDGVIFARSALLIFISYLWWVSWSEAACDSKNLEQGCVGGVGTGVGERDCVCWGKVSSKVTLQLPCQQIRQRTLKLHVHRQAAAAHISSRKRNKTGPKTCPLIMISRWYRLWNKAPFQ